MVMKWWKRLRQRFCTHDWQDQNCEADYVSGGRLESWRLLHCEKCDACVTVTDHWKGGYVAVGRMQ